MAKHHDRGATGGLRGAEPALAAAGDGHGGDLAKPPGADVDALAVIGAAIRKLRVEQGLSLRELGKLSGFSSGFLSLVERGKSSLAITSLQRIAGALGTDIASLFNLEASSDGRGVPHLSRANDGRELALVSAARTYILLSGRAPNRVLEPILMIIQPEAALEEPYGHEGEEFLYLLEGELLCSVGGIDYRLSPGDSLHLPSTIPHSYVNTSDTVVRALLVVTPRPW